MGCILFDPGGPNAAGFGNGPVLGLDGGLRGVRVQGLCALACFIGVRSGRNSSGYFDNAKICSAPRQVAGSCDIVRSALLNGRSALSFRQSARIGFQSPANVKVAPPDVHPVRRG